MKTRNATLVAALAVLLLAVAAVASGCGSSSAQDDGVASLDSAQATTTEDDGTGEDGGQDPQEAALEWASCMREHGVQVSDPQVGEDGRIQVTPGGNRQFDRNNEDFRAAMEECGSPFGNNGPPAVSEEEQEQRQETLLEFAACMRENGVDMPDPDFSGGGGGFRAGGPGSGIDPQSESFQQAQEACRDIIEDGFGPMGPGGGPGAGGGGNS